MVNGEAGKGSRYRPYSPKAWDKAWLRVFGEKCKYCKNGCPNCNWMGYFERKRR